jgi:hypothetical protein
VYGDGKMRVQSVRKQSTEFKNCGTDINDNNHTGQLGTARTDVNAAQVELIFENQQVTIQGH